MSLGEIKKSNNILEYKSTHIRQYFNSNQLLLLDTTLLQKNVKGKNQCSTSHNH